MIQNHKHQVAVSRRPSLSNLLSRVLSLPEFNLFLFAFLLHFVYEVWQAPFYDFYDAPTLADKILALTHCTFGDGVITVGGSLVVSLMMRSRRWITVPTRKAVAWFIILGWLYTFFSEIYRTHVASFYGVNGPVVPVIGISALPLLQWLVLPPLVIWFTRYQVLGHRLSSRTPTRS